MTRRRAAGTAFIVLTLLVACAYNTAPDWLRSPRFSGCSSDELRTITAAFVMASKLTDAALEAVNAPANRQRAESEIWNAYDWWFGEFAPGRFATVQAVFAATRAEFEHTIIMRCGAETVNCPQQVQSKSTPHRRSDDPDEYGPMFEGDRPPRREWQEFAYANHLIPVVQVCPDFFFQSRADQASILLHELTHVSSDTVDYAYREPSMLELARSNPGRAIRNAASFAAFAESVGAGRRPVPRTPTAGVGD